MNFKLRFYLLFAASMFCSLVVHSQGTPCTGVISTYPVTQSFENASNLWSQWNVAPLDWDRTLGPTPTPNTGPNAASDQLYYMLLEATGQVGSAVLESPCFDLTSLTDPQISFDYHMQGPDAFRLVFQASTDGGTSWGGLIFSVMGNQGPNWNNHIIDLGAYGNATNFRFRVIGVVGVTPGDLGDIAVDNFVIGEGPDCFDISVNFSYPTCPGTNDGSADLLVYPAGTTGLDVLWSTGETTNSINNLVPGNYSVVVTDNMGCTETKNFIIYDPLEIAANIYITPSSGSGVADGSITAAVYGGSTPYTLLWLNGSTGATNSGLQAGYEELKVTDANGCVQYFPVFVGEASTCSGSYNNWPYHLSFDGNLGRFKQSYDDDRNWKKRSSATPTANTGPSGSAQGSRYRYVESSGNGGPFKTGALVSRKCFDITSLPNPELYFQYHMYGSQMGQLFVQASRDGGVTWRENLWEISGDQGNNWNEAFINLNGYITSQLVIRIVARTGSGSLSDIAIDDLHIRSAVPASAQQLDPIGESYEGNISTRELSERSSSSVFPNPIMDKVHVEFAEGTQTIQILDFKGSVLKSQKAEGLSSTIMCDDLQPGLYLLRIINNEGVVESHKVLKL